MSDIVDLDNLDRDQAVRVLHKIADWMMPGVQLPLIPDDRSFDAEERLPNGQRRWLNAKEAAAVIGCTSSRLYAMLQRNPGLCRRVGPTGSRIFVDRMTILKMR